MRSFEYTSFAQQVIFGPGVLANLEEQLAQFGINRVLLCTSGSYTRNGTTARVGELLGTRLVAVFDEVRPHVPDTVVDRALAIAEERAVDGVIGLGGGSAVGTAKAVSMALEEQRSGQAARSRRPVEQPLVPVVAIPTTYAGSEMTPIYGVTHSRQERKITVTDSKVTPKLTLYDPELTLDLPAELTASTGVNALAHCVEGLYSITRSPVTTATALGGIRHIVRALPHCVARGDDLAARIEMLTGAYLAATTIANARIGLHHGICHVLGGTAGVPHGVANCIMLPHVMRFNLPACASELAPAAREMGIDTSGTSEEEAVLGAADAVADLIAAIKMPQRLRDAGVDEADLPRLSELALSSSAVRANPVPVNDAAQIESLLRAAW